MLYLPRNLHFEVHKVLYLPRNLHFEVHKVLHLSRNLHFKVHQVLHLPRNLHFEVHQCAAPATKSALQGPPRSKTIDAPPLFHLSLWLSSASAAPVFCFSPVQAQSFVVTAANFPQAGRKTCSGSRSRVSMGAAVRPGSPMECLRREVIERRLSCSSRG